MSTESANRTTTPVGAHLRTGGKGLGSHVLPRLRSVGGEAVQVFVGNPRGWRPAPGDPKQDALFRALCEEHEVAAFIHTPYLVNLGSPTEQTYTNSIATVAHNLRRGGEIGARGVVVHTGSCVAQGTVEAAMKQVRDGLLPILEALDDDAPMLLLEPTAGQGQSLCAGVDDIEAYLDVLDGHRAMSGVPVLLETPGGDAPTREDIATLKELRGRT